MNTHLLKLLEAAEDGRVDIDAMEDGLACLPLMWDAYIRAMHGSIADAITFATMALPNCEWRIRQRHGASVTGYETTDIIPVVVHTYVRGRPHHSLVIAVLKGLIEIEKHGQTTQKPMVGIFELLTPEQQRLAMMSDIDI